jgi:mono/diheme cytochrome c family protein
MSFLGIAVCFLIASCRQDMYNQPKVKPYSASDFFSDGSNARPLPPHTVEYQSGNREDALHTGVSNGTLVARMPVPLTPGLLERGRECFGIYCAVCHGLTGEGDGEVVRRGFPAPPTYHSDRLRNAPIGHLYDVITNGYGVMYSYASRLAPEDRWAVAAYIRALQLSQHALLSDLPPNEQERVETVP